MTRACPPLISRLARTICQQQLFRAHDRLVVALSGGADSCALLDLLTRLPGYDLVLVAAHLNHGLRGAESDGDEQFCRELAAGYGIPFESCRIDVGALAQAEGLNLEDAGRRARISFLDAVRQQHGAAAVVTAHHSDDQAETVLMRLLRGSGMAGLSGMRYRNQRGYLRPLLDVTRAQIEQHLVQEGLAWREDASNRDTNFLRNRIRHELLPLLEQYNPAIRQRLTSTAAILADEEQLLESLAETAFEELFRRNDGGLAGSIAGLKTHPAALQRRILRLAYRQLTGNLDGLGLEHIEAVLRLPDSPRPNARLALPQNISVLRAYDRLLFRSGPENPPDPAVETVISAPGQYRVAGGGILTIETASAPVDFNNLPADSACFDLYRTPFPWLVRTFQPGDRMAPFGLGGSKKVKEIFINRKIPLAERRRIPLVFCGEDLIWIAGVCTSELCRIDDAASSVILVSWRT